MTMKSELIVIDANLYSELKTDINFIKEALMQLQGRSPNGPDQWLTPAETRKVLGIGRTKYFEMKAEGAFVFSQFGRTAKISRKSIEVFLKKNIVK